MTISEKLKDKTLAQPFGLRSKEEQEVLKKAGKDNCLSWIDIKRGWTNVGTDMEHWECTSYILKPDYEPEPDYVDWKIENANNLLCVAERPAGKATTFKPLYSVPAMPTFVKFFSGHNQDVTVSLSRVAEWMRHKPVFARFRKE